MTDLEKVRKALMNQLKKIEDNESTQKEVDSVVSISNSVIKSYNVEVRADELTTNNTENTNKAYKNKVFENDSKV